MQCLLKVCSVCHIFSIFRGILLGTETNLKFENLCSKEFYNLSPPFRSGPHDLISRDLCICAVSSGAGLSITACSASDCIFRGRKLASQLGHINFIEINKSCQKTTQLTGKG